MTDLRDPLDDLVSEVGLYVVPDARGAWRAGARRRTRRRAGVAAAVVAAGLLAAGLASVLPRAADVEPAAQAESLGYPAHVDDPWRLHDLPEQPGAVSAVVETGDGGWLAAAPDGRVWRVPQADMDQGYPPALSDDGRMLGYLAGPSTFVLHDLVTGEKTTFDDVTESDTSQARSGAFGSSARSPSYWSPDGSMLVVPGAKWVAGIHVHAVVLAVDGSKTEMKDPPQYPVGWLDDDTIGWLEDGRLIATDVTGQRQGSVALGLDAATASTLTQWSATLSPDRSRLAIALPDATGTIVTVATEDGSVLGSDAVGAPSSCAPAWAGGQPAFLRASGDQPASMDTTTGEQTIVVDPAIATTCVLTAADALEGPRHERLGDRWFHDGWLSWHWQEAGLGVLAALLLVVAAVLVLVRRRRLSAR